METTLSEQSLELLNALQIAPRATWRQLAGVLGSKPSTLSQRLDDLRSRGVAWVTAMFSGATRHSAIAFVEVGCTMERQTALGDEFVANPNIVSVERLTQGPNFGLTIVADSLESMAMGPLEFLAGLPGVTSIQTSASVAMHHGAHLWRLEHLDKGQIEALKSIHREMTAPDTSIVLGADTRPIVQMLQLDGRCSAADIARRLDLAPATARRRLDRVLRSEEIVLRTELAQSRSGWPVNVQWFARLPAGDHDRAAQRLAELNPRMIASVTGNSNLLITFWLRSLHDVLTVEQMVEQAVPTITIDHSAVLINALKRQGWVLNSDGSTTGEFVSS